MVTADRIMLLAPAKVNLYLAVGARRSDGYHDVVTVLQALDERVADIVELSVSDSLEVVCAPDIGVPAEENLVYRALERIGEIAGRTPGFRARVVKRVPAGGGLGGASSDAAAALVGACRLWGLDESDMTVTALAASLGADVPFFLEGGTALYAGRGDVLVRRLPTPALDLVVVNPGVPVATPAAYAAFDRMLPAPIPDVAAVIEAIASGDAARVAAALFNNLAEPAQVVAPEISDTLHCVLQSEGVLGAMVSGSGSCVVGICENASTAGIVATAASANGWWSAVASAAPGGIVDIT